MITFPSNYQEATVFTGEFETLPKGGYICKIMKAEQEFSRMGSPMLVLYLDIAEGDYINFFQRQYKAQNKENKKWGCIYRQLLTEQSASFLKGLVTCIEQSNNMTWDGEEAALKNKLLGMLFGREQFRGKTGKFYWTTKPLQPRSIEVIRSGEFDLPEDKFYGASESTHNSDFKDLSDQDLPF